ncbi:hypothetical protein B0A52_09958 [Exophiala mesophila]|uniref:MADS-box domain-containing protein n=1 Tax=Exophiala mesophila TaxID=212818 RepID=A0A438MRW4_EXOME|nr:hypothetical protein B0A52_09958 [Exophiala mesophila]
MGRRKIEIRAIKDDRNRSVTFLKRKGGLFKKAYELSVLCSVDVAVIIFGHNKKLYEFSSGDINETLRRYSYYGPPHEHKGPGDFKGKGGDDDDDEDEDDDQPAHAREDSLPPAHAMPHVSHHNAFTHVQQPMASVSPPMPNGVFQRHSTPQPQLMVSRPPSQNMIRRTSSTLVPMQQHPTPTPPQNGYAYTPNPPIYNPSAGPSLPPHPSPQPQYQQFPPQQQHAPQPTPPPTQMPQAHQQYLQEQQRQIHPPPAVTQPTLQPPALPQARTSPRPENQSLRPPPQTSPPQSKHGSSKSRSIFTPIDEGGSVLAQHFFGAPDPPRSQREDDVPSLDIKPPPRSITSPQIALPPTQSAIRSHNTSVPEFAPPQRTNTTGSKSGARPKLNLQIPSEAEDNDSPTGGSPLQSAGPSANPARSGDHIVLPPPSPSASAVMSAGASGPPNPFARPPPPASNQNRDAYGDNRNNIETPISALPSRYMNNDLLPSPSNFFSEWYDNGRNSAVLPSPLVFPTPSNDRGLGFGSRDQANESSGEKRKGSVDEREGDAKKVKA